MDQSKIDRINELAKKKKVSSLTPEELEEQRKLREEYILSFRASMTGILDNTYIQYANGEKVKVQKKK